MGFSQIFIARMPGPFVEGIDWSPILTREDEDLVALFTLDEVKKAVFSCDRNKSLGADGFSMAFFQDNWNIIEEDLEGCLRNYL